MFGLFKAIGTVGSWVGGLFGSSESADKVLVKTADGIYNGLDKLWYTPEEKAEALAEGRKLFVKFAGIAYDQNSIRSVTRRWLAFTVVGTNMGMYILASVFYILGTFFTSDAFIKCAEFLAVMATDLSPWSAGVLAFYFGPHIIGSIRKQPK